MKGRPLFVGCADVHLIEKPPVFRSKELDWFEAQWRPLKWMGEYARELGCPIVVAGDIFDSAIGSSRLVNYFASHFPECYAIPGNHDLLNRNPDNLMLSSYYNLSMLGVLKGMEWIDGEPRVQRKVEYNIGDIKVVLHLFPYGEEFRPCEKSGDVDVAVIHHYVWHGKNDVLAKKLPHCEMAKLKEELSGYDYYLFGDNHTPFKKDNVVNCGSFYRRKRGDEEYKPKIWVLYEDGYEGVEIPIDKDVVYSAGRELKNSAGKYNFNAFCDSLSTAERMTCDVGELLKEQLASREVNEDVYRAILFITES